jgi:hypothetical protein
MSRLAIRLLFAVILATLGIGAAVAPVSAAEGEGESGAGAGVEWRLEQPSPPAAPVGVSGSSTPIGLGEVGDVEFWAPNRGVLITPGNGSTIPAGLWAYNGQGWHELSSVCGATDGRVAWAGPEEFWTISNGRPGQAANPANDAPAPIEDDTLCHFAPGPSQHDEVVGSYASPAFQASSYQPMHALGCISPADCWFAGDPLPRPENGESFHLNWNGSSLTAEPNPHGHTVEDMRAFEGRLLESVRISTKDAPAAEPETPFPFALNAINPSGVTPTFESFSGVPLYAGNGSEFPEALDYLHLGADQESLWAAAGPASEPPAESSAAPLTVVRYSGGEWTQVLGPNSTPPGSGAIKEDVVNSIAPEPGTDSAWIALNTQVGAEQQSPTESALIAHVTPGGSVETQTLPSPAEVAAGVGPKGGAKQISCPAANDCWMITTQGWIFHLAPEGERQLEPDSSPALSTLITFRPLDAGLPQVTPDAPPPDDSGEVAAVASRGSVVEEPAATETKVRAALLSNIHSRLLHGTTTLELRFHLAVKSRVKLVAKRKNATVASTPTRTFAGGNRKLLLKLNRRKWPTKLDLQTHALATLPLVSTRLPGNNTVGTNVVSLPGTAPSGSSNSLIAPFRGSLP